MGRLHLRNIVLPAVLVSCATFSSFTLPFILSDPNPISINLPPLFEGEIQPIFRRESKGAAIRHIGLAIVSSVGAGLLTVEVLRRLQPAERSEPVQPHDDDAEYPITDHIYHSAMHPVVSEGSEQPVYQLNNYLSSELLTENPLFIAAEEEFNLDSEFSSAQEESQLTPLEWITASPTQCNLIPVLDQDGQTCHIKTAESTHSQFALHWNEEYYRFFRVQPIREKALTIAQRLSNRGEQVVITEQEQGFVVWVKESSASVELVS